MCSFDVAFGCWMLNNEKKNDERIIHFYTASNACDIHSRWQYATWGCETTMGHRERELKMPFARCVKTHLARWADSPWRSPWKEAHELVSIQDEQSLFANALSQKARGWYLKHRRSRWFAIHPQFYLHLNNLAIISKSLNATFIENNFFSFFVLKFFGDVNRGQLTQNRLIHRQLRPTLGVNIQILYNSGDVRPNILTKPRHEADELENSPQTFDAPNYS